MKNKVELSLSLDIVKKAAREYLHFGHEGGDSVVDVLMAVPVANKLDADPLWIQIVAPSAQMKTELCGGYSNYEDAVMLSSLTSKTLISGRITSNRQNCSLLFKLDGKLLVIKDFTSILSGRREDRAEIFAQFREIYDGQYSKSFGTGESISWEGKIGMVVGVTPIIERFWSHNQALGERFLVYRLRGQTQEGSRKVARKALDKAVGTRADRKTFQWAVSTFLGQFDDDIDASIAEDKRMEEKLANLATFCAHARTSVIRNSRDQRVEVMPEAEGPGRLAKQFRLLATGLALVREQNTIDSGIYEILKKVACDTMPQMRRMALATLYFCKPDEWHKTRKISTRVGIPFSTTKLLLEDLNLLGLVEKDLEGSAQKAAYIWRATDFMRSLADESGIFRRTVCLIPDGFT
jgi:hypothetical protein